MSIEKRRHKRLAFQGTIFIELLALGMGGDEGEVLVCKAVDISHAGLRVEVKRQLTVGAILQIGVDLSSVQDTLYLAGEVIWCRKDDPLADNWLVGFALMNANDSDIKAWRLALTKMGSADNCLSADNDL